MAAGKLASIAMEMQPELSGGCIAMESEREVYAGFKVSLQKKVLSNS